MMDAQPQKTRTKKEISRHWLDVLEEYGVRFMALDPMHDTRLIEQLQIHAEWIVEYASDEAIFFVRDELPLGY